MTQFAIWLDSFFSAFDMAILEFWHSVAVSAGAFLTPIMEFISLFGDKGIALIILGLVLLLFPKTRKTGLCILLALACGALITNVALKPLIARVRPYEASLTIKGFWEFVGAAKESDLSFPSGHATATAAALTALTLIRGKKYLWISIPGILLMCASRNYLMVHYPTDVIAGVIVGVSGAVAALFITKLIYKHLEKNSEKKFCDFMLNSGPAGRKQ